MESRDPFEVLGLTPEATEAEVTAAFRKLARRHHPDQHPGDSLQQRRRRESEMAEINTAHAALLNGWTRPAEPRRAPPPKTPGQSHSRPRVPPPPPPRQRSTPPADPPTGEPVPAWRVLTVLGIGGAVVVAVLAIVIGLLSPDTGPTPTDEQPVLVDVESWTVGTCVTDGPEAAAVRCEFPNRGMVVADVFTADQCPAGTDGYALDPPRVLCIDFDT